MSNAENTKFSAYSRFPWQLLCTDPVLRITSRFRACANAINVCSWTNKCSPDTCYDVRTNAQAQVANDFLKFECLYVVRFDSDDKQCTNSQHFIYVPRLLHMHANGGVISYAREVYSTPLRSVIIRLRKRNRNTHRSAGGAHETCASSPSRRCRRVSSVRVHC